MELFQVLTEYLTEERLHNVLSHDEFTNKDFNKILGLFVQDAREEYEDEHEPIDKKTWKVLVKHINTHSANILKPVYMERFL